MFLVVFSEFVDLHVYHININYSTYVWFVIVKGVELLVFCVLKDTSR